MRIVRVVALSTALLGLMSAGAEARCWSVVRHHHRVRHCTVAAVRPLPPPPNIVPADAQPTLHLGIWRLADPSPWFDRAPRP